MLLILTPRRAPRVPAPRPSRLARFCPTVRIEPWSGAHPPHDDPADEAPGVGGRATRVLHVEDSRIDARIVPAYLKQAAPLEFRVHQVRSLAEAAQALDAEPFDVILADLHLPDAGPAGTLRTLRRHARDAPIVVLSNVQDSRTAIEAIRDGASEVLLKHALDAARLADSLRRLAREHLRRAAAASIRRHAAHTLEWARAAFDALPQRALACEPDGTLRAFSRAALAALDDRSATYATHLGELARLPEAIAQDMAARRPLDAAAFAAPALLAAGWAECAWSLSSMRDARGAVIGYVATFAEPDP